MRTRHSSAFSPRRRKLAHLPRLALRDDAASKRRFAGAHLPYYELAARPGAPRDQRGRSTNSRRTRTSRDAARRAAGHEGKRPTRLAHARRRGKDTRGAAAGRSRAGRAGERAGSDPVDRRLRPAAGRRPGWCTVPPAEARHRASPDVRSGGAEQGPLLLARPTRREPPPRSWKLDRADHCRVLADDRFALPRLR